MAAPLEGIKVVDFGLFLAGPGAAKILADLGASVIKVEELQGVPLRGPNNSSKDLGAGYSVFHQAFGGKRSIGIDLKNKEGLEVAHKLIAQADVVMGAFRTTSVADRLGIGYEVCKRINPQVVYVTAPGYGDVGPRSGLGIAEPLNSTFAGVHYNTGGQGNPPSGSTSFDQFCALLSANAVVMALFHKARTGEGQYVDNTQLAQVLYFTSQAFLVPGGKLGANTEVDAMQTGFGPLDRLYETKDDWVCIVAKTEQEWRALCRAVDQPDLATDKRFSSAAAREANGDDLAAVLEPLVASKTSTEWMRIFDREGVPAEIPVKHGQTRAMLNDEYLRLGLIHEIEHDAYPAVRVPGAAAKLSDTPLTPAERPPKASEHSREILSELGYSSAAIEDLAKKRAIGLPEGATPAPALR